MTPSEKRIQDLENTLREVIGCVDAAYAEGLAEMLAEEKNTDTGSLHDLVTRRLLYTKIYAEEALALSVQTAKELPKSSSPGVIVLIERSLSNGSWAAIFQAPDYGVIKAAMGRSEERHVLALCKSVLAMAPAGKHFGIALQAGVYPDESSERGLGVLAERYLEEFMANMNPDAPVQVSYIDDGKDYGSDYATLLSRLTKIAEALPENQDGTVKTVVIDAEVGSVGRHALVCIANAFEHEDMAMVAEELGLIDTDPVSRPKI